MSLWSIWGDAAEFIVHPDPEEHHLSFVFVETGTFTSRYADEPWLAFEAGLIVAPHGIARQVRFNESWRVLIAQMPRAALTAFVPQLPNAVSAFPDRRLLDQAMKSFLTEVIDRNESTSAIERYAIEQLVMEMGGAVLLDRLGTGGVHGSPRAVLRDRALAVIAQQGADLSLTPSRVAHDVSSSLRHLQSIFAEAGTTVAGEIRRQRARLARSLLTDSRYDVLTVEQVAQRSGFGNAMSLRRALHDVYRASPRTLRSGRGQ
ncbi:AraC family transcriptional regulator [Microbacterium murale]|uniref:AraC family transcriptional regulator n=1 Tax=Microbacterium murale TaxID=1081040 RepID=UPI0027D8B5A2|nr:helix-turn-helix domain-containing protein [Microbacterium murale]